MSFLRRLTAGLMVLSAFLMISACTKIDTDKMLDTESHFAGLAVFNGIGIADPMTLRLDDKMINFENEEFKPGTYLKHRTVFPGIRHLNLFSKGLEEFNSKFEISLKSGEFYTAYYFGIDNPKVLYEPDDILAPKGNNIKYRFVNLVESGNIRIQTEKNNQIEGTTIGIKATAFKEVPRSDMMIEVSVPGTKIAPIKLEFIPEASKGYSICFYEFENKGTAIHELRYEIIKL